LTVAVLRLDPFARAGGKAGRIDPLAVRVLALLPTIHDAADAALQRTRDAVRHGVLAFGDGRVRRASGEHLYGKPGLRVVLVRLRDLGNDRRRSAAAHGH
jgi:hypothetical protein